MRETEALWRELLLQIEANTVIPVIGPGLLAVDVDGQEVPLYQRVAERLLGQYLPDSGRVLRRKGALRRFHELNDAVSILTGPPGSLDTQDLYSPIYEILKEEVQNAAASTLQPLHDLAGILDFKVFISTTPDDLLANAVDAVRFPGLPKAQQIVYSHKLASGAIGDLPENRLPGYTAVCYLFGKASPSPLVFAIHDEDTLEFIHKFQRVAPDAMKRLFSELQNQNLLLIGCNLSDWLSRFFIRLSNTDRLADKRTKREFLIERSEDGHNALVLFLERFSPNTWTYSVDARAFVTELASRWHTRRELSARMSLPSSPSPTAPVPRVIAEKFFISYAGEDIDAARALRDDLNDLGADIAWMDKSALKAGEPWFQVIMEAIKDCYLFLPLISANSDRRDEGVFRKEWHAANERSRGIQEGRRFIVPIVIDPDYDGKLSRYRSVPKDFQSLHVGQAPGGKLVEPLRGELQRLIRERRTMTSV